MVFESIPPKLEFVNMNMQQEAPPGNQLVFPHLFIAKQTEDAEKKRVSSSQSSSRSNK
jgi:hypothetical protein